jgi:hypothetical protein
MDQSTAAAPIIFLVGKDELLLYLLQRYFEQSLCQLIPWLSIPTITEIKRITPSVIIFSTIEFLEDAQSLLDRISDQEIPILVCTSLACEAQARELGADACLIHPLTYEHFKLVLASVCPVNSNVSG